MSGMLNMVKKSIPIPVKKRLLKLRALLPAKLDFTWTLKSGLKIRVTSKADWVMYNDIFVDGEYDAPILAALGAYPVEGKLNVLDLGANVGFFTLRFITLMRLSGGDSRQFKITLVEGSPTVAKELHVRLLEDNQLSQNVRIVHGLVGKRTGSAKIVEHDFHAMSTIVSDEDGWGVKANFIDVETLFGADEVIDLLKCDIEGSELNFLESYAGMLRRVRAAVFELHHDRCDTQKCMKIMSDAGFTDQRALRVTPTFSVYHFLR